MEEKRHEEVEGGKKVTAREWFYLGCLGLGAALGYCGCLDHRLRGHQSPIIRPSCSRHLASFLGTR